MALVDGIHTGDYRGKPILDDPEYEHRRAARGRFWCGVDLAVAPLTTDEDWRGRPLDTPRRRGLLEDGLFRDEW